MPNKKRHHLFVAFVVTGSVFFISPLLAQTTFTVTNTDDTVSDGVCDADCTLRDAVDEANAAVGADTIEVPAGTYVLDIDDSAAGDNANARGDLDITEEVTINGDSGGGTIIDSGDGTLTTPDRVIHILFNSGTFTLNNVTIQNGAPNDFGGGINHEMNSHMTIDNCIFLNNSAVPDGGGFNYVTSSGILTLTNSTFTGNKATEDGGGAQHVTGVDGSSVDGTTFDKNEADRNGAGFFYVGNDLTVENSVFTGNLAGQDGGGLFFVGDDLIIETITADDNTANRDGGGVYSVGDSTSITGSTISNNDTITRDGGGAYVNVNPDALTIVNSTFSGNSADAGDGGGVWADSTIPATLTNVTIVNNSASATTGGGVFNDGAAGSIVFKNSIIANNTPGGDCGPGGFTSDGNNISSDTSCFDASDSTDSPDTDPLLADLADTGGPTQTHAPLANSPAIDNADDGAAPAKDQRGVDRDANPDIGAHEVGPCGDGFLEVTEECDDGTGNSDTLANACRTDCTEPSCGDGVVDTGEECDGGDGCSDTCTTEGDGNGDGDGDGDGDGNGCSLRPGSLAALSAITPLFLIFLVSFALRRRHS